MARVAKEAQIESVRKDETFSTKDMEEIGEEEDNITSDVMVRDKRFRRCDSSPVGEVLDKDWEIPKFVKDRNQKRSSTVSFTIPKSSWWIEEKHRKSANDQKRANVIVTSGALIFILISAALVTASFLISPVLETIFSK